MFYDYGFFLSELWFNVFFRTAKSPSWDIQVFDVFEYNKLYS